MSCKDLRWSLVSLGAGLGGCAAEDGRFHYDYTALRLGGLIFAGTMLIAGIIVLLSEFKVFRLKKRDVAQAVSDGQAL